jgi:GT2 family glycosyltransferase
MDERVSEVRAAAIPRPAAHDRAIVVALVNYCTPGLTIDCLRSLEQEVATLPGSYVVVADNASPDGSGAQIADAIRDNAWSGWARVVPQPKNGGFSYGNNAVIREDRARAQPAPYVWLLNTDTIVRPGALRTLVAFLEQNPRAGIAGSRLEDPDTTRQCSAFRFHSIAGEFEGSLHNGLVSRLLRRWVMAPDLPDHPQRFDWLSGASMLIRREVFDSIGLMDEAYFLYFEETDFCRRAADAGWSCWYVPESRVVHLVGKSTGVTDAAGRVRRRAPFWFESRRRYFVTHHGRLYAALADLSLAAGTALALVRDRLFGRPAAYPEKFLSDLARHSVVLNPSRAEKIASDRERPR